VLRCRDVIKDFVFKDKDLGPKAKDFVIKAKLKSLRTHHCLDVKNSRPSSCSLMKNRHISDASWKISGVSE